MQAQVHPFDYQARKSGPSSAYGPKSADKSGLGYPSLILQIIEGRSGGPKIFI